MNKTAIVLLLGGLVVAAITLVGYSAASRPSSDELLHQSILDLQAQQRQEAADLAELGKQALEVPAECTGVKTAPFFMLCEMEGEPDEPEPDWSATVTPEEQACLSAALHRTNELAYLLQQREYVEAERTSARAIDFACDVAGATMYAEGIGWGDADASGEALLRAFFAERTESHYGPKRSY